MAPKKTADSDQRVICAALRKAINAYDTDEKTFRQVVEDLQNGRDVPMFVRGDAGIKAARHLADGAYRQAQEAKEVLARLEGEDAEAEAS